MTHIPRGQSWKANGGVSRRQFISSLSTVSAATLLAGCLGGDDDSDDNPTDDTDGNSTNDDGGDDDNGGVEDDGSTEDGGEDDGSDDDDGTGDEDVPESFEDPDVLRDLSREYIELLGNGEMGTAARWSAPEAAQFLTASSLQNAWDSVVGVNEPPASYRSVSYLGTETGNDIFTAWAEIDGDEYQFTITYGSEGVLGFLISPIQEWSRPEYVDQSALTEEEVTLDTPLDCELGGTLTLPVGEEPVPGVVIVHGNGPEDRDATVGPNRMYKELAWGLASNGVAVLRYDKRTFACEVDLADATIDDIVTADALTALEKLRSHDRVDEDRTFVAGHSFGGLLTPRIASLDGNVAGTVMLAPGPARSFGQTIIDQTKHLLDLQGVSGSRREEAIADVEAEAEKMANLDIEDDEVVRFGGREFHQTLQEYDHETTAAELAVPQLLLQGGNDWQVTVENDLPVWQDALEDNENARIRVYDGLNHLFQRSDPPLTQSEYARQKNHVDGEVVEDIVAFIQDTVEDSTESIARPPLIQ